MKTTSSIPLSRLLYRLIGQVKNVAVGDVTNGKIKGAARDSTSTSTQSLLGFAHAFLERKKEIKSSSRGSNRAW